MRYRKRTTLTESYYTALVVVNNVWNLVAYCSKLPRSIGAGLW
ncbi:hypothetical protein EF53_229 [Enterococcus phage 53]|nr:hypothetical protein EF53_229 [Enterococcus phage 53]